MKSIFLFSKYIFCASIFSAFAFAQSNQVKKQTQSRIDSTDRSLPNPSSLARDSKKSTQVSGSKSDTGAQRPILLKKKGITTFFSYDSKYFYRSNPLASSGKLTQAETALWTNTFAGGVGLGVFDAGNSVVTPYVGGSWTTNDFEEGVLSKFNYNSTNAYIMLLSQYGNGWSARVGISYSNDRGAETDTEDYSEIYPSIGVMKAYKLSDETTGIFSASAGFHDSSSEDLFGISEAVLSNWDASISYSLKHSLGDITIRPSYALTYKTYDKSVNKDRDDFINSLSLKLEYPITESFNASVFAGYTNRSSSGSTLGDEVNDYESWDGGAGLGLSARF